MQQRPGQQGPDAFCAAKLHVQQWVGLEVDQQEPVPWLGRAVGIHQIVGHGRDQGAGHQRGCSGHEAVDQHHPSLAGGLDHRAAQHGNLETSHGGQSRLRRGGAAVPAGGSEQPLQLALPEHLVCFLILATGIGQRNPAQAGQQQGRRGLTRNADAAQRHHIAGQVPHHIHACLDGRARLCLRHGRRQRRVACAVAYLAPKEGGGGLGALGQLNMVGDTGVHEGHIEAMVPGQRTGRALAREQLAGALVGQVLRRFGHTLIRDAVVGSKYHQLGRLEPKFLQSVP